MEMPSEEEVSAGYQKEQWKLLGQRHKHAIEGAIKDARLSDELLAAMITEYQELLEGR
jgi:hypothetical protein